MLNIYYGRENIDKDKFIFDRVSGRTLLLVPDQFTLQAERNAFKYLGVQGLMDIEVISPSRLGLRVLKEVGGEKVSRLDKYGRHMLLSKIIAEEKDQLEVFRGMEAKTSFIELVNNLISEMKQYNTPPEAIPEILNKLDKDSILYKKLKDMQAVYEKYEAVIAERYIDTEDYLEHCINKMKHSRMIKENEIWVYGFDYFTPKNLDLIRELIDNAINVNVVMTYGEDSRDSEIFALTGSVIEKLQKLSEGLSKPYCTKQINDEKCIKKGIAVELSAIESELFSIPVRKWQQEAPAVTLVKAANPYAEAETAAAYITRLLREEGLRYKDIVVICNDLETRGSIINRVFKEYGLNPFMDKKRSILHNPVISLNIYLLQIALGRMDIETVMGFIKTGLVGLPQDAVEQLENYAYKYKIRGNMWKKEFTRGIKEYEPEELNEINQARDFVMQIISAFAEPFKKAENVGQKIAVLYYFLKDNLQLPQRIEEIMEEQNQKGYYEMAFEMAQIWKIVVEIYDQLVTIMGEEKLEVAELETIIRAGFESVEIGMLPATIDEIIVGTMQRTRTGQVKALIVIGANDGILPSTVSGDGILNDDEKTVLLNNQVEICKLDELRAMEEKIAMYRTMSKPEQYLFMSYSVSDNDGKELKPSAVFNKIASLFPKAGVRKDVISQENPINLLEAKNNGIKHLTEALRKNLDGEPLNECFKAALNWYRMDEYKPLNQVKEGLFFKIKEKDLSIKVAEMLYKREENTDLSISPSRLEKFGRCPFAHFINYGLKPEEKRIFEIAGREIGDIYHLCLMKLSEHLTEKGVPITDQNSRWMNITTQECAEFVSEFMDTEGTQYREGIFSGGNEESYKAGRLKRVCTDAALILVEHVQQGKIQDVFFEAEFGKVSRKHFPPIEVETSQGKVLVEGKIDRVDLLPGDYVKIIDYKSGSEKFDIDEAKGGWRLQLMLYLKAALGNDGKMSSNVVETRPAGIFYFKLDEPVFNASDWANEQIEDKIKAEFRKSFKLDGILVNETDVIESIAGDFAGTSDIVPIRRNKEGLIVGTGKDKLLTSEEFAELQNAVDNKISELCEQLAQGNVEVAPRKSGNETACKYCMYKSVCKFDLAFEGCTYKTVK
ncbi:PD-(D/E)XK nuclease family protein [Aminipila sp.]|uniref:PD-(D/E)XK nuclease family protein n=1 Tax=Aminipila sp. TaxID=2060095 RepID=UPI00289E3616|nr:PD-(D/E)XK nuclease family protein [Aminipila sp.]